MAVIGVQSGAGSVAGAAKGGGGIPPRGNQNPRTVNIFANDSSPMQTQP